MRDDKYSWWILIFCIIALFVIMLGTNACSAPAWNGGKCPNCEIRYELRGASRDLKYYSCPDCGKEVERY
jgi:hypothetical protein